jgi:hypothetical protein
VFVCLVVRLRGPVRVRTVGAMKYGWIHARDSTRICSTTVPSSRRSFAHLIAMVALVVLVNVLGYRHSCQ